MVLDLGISDVLSITQTIGIIGTLLIALYFSRRQTRELTEEHLLERPELSRVINIAQSLSPEGAHDVRERKVLNDNEWYGWIQWMRTCFRLGTIKESWKRIQESKWYDPVFEDFINKQIIAYVEREIRQTDHS
jgi:hypothetical protein